MSRQHATGLTALVVAVILAVPAGAVEREINDPNVTHAVEREYLYDHAVPFDRISVSTQDGVVTLEGTVDNLLARRRAVQMAETVKGVRSVIDRVTVQPPENITDATVEDNVKTSLLRDPATDSYEVDVTASDGHVTLEGTVQSWKERELCATVAEGVRGVTELTNDIAVEYVSDRPDHEIRLEIEQALRWNSLVDDVLIDVSVEDGEVTLSGTVGSAAEKRQARYDAWTNGVESVDVSSLRVEQWARDDDLRKSRYTAVSDGEIRDALEDALSQDPRVFSFNVTPFVSAGRVTLRGLVDNLQAKRSAEATARNTVGVLAVNNHLRVRSDVNASSTEIETQILESFARDPLLWVFDLRARVYSGTAYLSGTVDTYFERARADELASRVPGVVEVVNNLHVETSATAFDPYIDDWPPTYFEWYEPRPVTYKTDLHLESDIRSELWWSPFVDEDQVTVEVDDGIATLTGSVDTWMEWGAAQDNAYDAGAVSVRNRLTVN